MAETEKLEPLSPMRRLILAVELAFAVLAGLADYKLGSTIVDDHIKDPVIGVLGALGATCSVEQIEAYMALIAGAIALVTFYPFKRLMEKTKCPECVFFIVLLLSIGLWWSGDFVLYKQYQKVITASVRECPEPSVEGGSVKIILPSQPVGELKAELEAFAAQDVKYGATFCDSKGAVYVLDLIQREVENGRGAVKACMRIRWYYTAWQALMKVAISVYIASCAAVFLHLFFFLFEQFGAMFLHWLGRRKDNKTG